MFFLKSKSYFSSKQLKKVLLNKNKFKVSYNRVMKVKIKEAAKLKKDYSLYKLAKELNLPAQTVYSWAKGRSQPSYLNLDKICSVLECGIEDILEPEPIQNTLF